MFAVRPTPNYFIQDRLNEIRNFPCVSSTHVALNLPRLLKRYQLPTEWSINVPLYNELTAKGVVRAVGMSIITYLALNSLSMISALVNGTVGAGKVALSLIVTMSDYKTAQNLLEEGTYHLLTAVADFAISYFSLIRAGVALAAGIAPRHANAIYEKVYRPWDGAIQHADDASEGDIARDRKEYCYLQGVADAVQCMVMPNSGEGRFSSAWAALNGNQPIPTVTKRDL